MDKLISDIRSEMAVLEYELDKCKTNASAAARARKCTSNLGVLFKEFRKVSVAHHKK